MRIFVSYRREDSRAFVGRLYDRLVAEFDRENIALDTVAIPAGDDFRSFIGQLIAGSDAVIAVMGPDWRGERESGSARIFDAGDLVRIELELALARKVPVFPVLVDGTSMPSVVDLPDSLLDLSYRQAMDVDSGRDFQRGMDALVKALRFLESNQESPRSGSSKNSSEEPMEVVLLVRGEDSHGDPVFAYVALPIEELPQFMEAQNGPDPFYPEDHGTIIESGEGEPSREVQEKMAHFVGFDHKGMLDIANSSAARLLKAAVGRGWFGK